MTRTKVMAALVAASFTFATGGVASADQANVTWGHPLTGSLAKYFIAGEISTLRSQSPGCKSALYRTGEVGETVAFVTRRAQEEKVYHAAFLAGQNFANSIKHDQVFCTQLKIDAANWSMFPEVPVTSALLADLKMLVSITNTNCFDEEYGGTIKATAYEQEIAELRASIMQTTFELMNGYPALERYIDDAYTWGTHNANCPTIENYFREMDNGRFAGMMYERKLTDDLTIETVSVEEWAQQITSYDPKAPKAPKPGPELSAEYLQDAALAANIARYCGTHLTVTIDAEDEELRNDANSERYGTLYGEASTTILDILYRDVRGDLMVMARRNANKKEMACMEVHKKYPNLSSPRY